MYYSNFLHFVKRLSADKDKFSYTIYLKNHYLTFWVRFNMKKSYLESIDKIIILLQIKSLEFLCILVNSNCYIDIAWLEYWIIQTQKVSIYIFQRVLGFCHAFNLSYNLSWFTFNL